VHKVIIEARPDGTSSVKAEGIKGEACKHATMPFIRNLGGVVTSDVPTEELSAPVYGAEETQNKIQQRH